MYLCGHLHHAKFSWVKRRGWVVDDGGKSARPVAYAVSDGFVPTDAATLPDGSVLVLERAFSIR